MADEKLTPENDDLEAMLNAQLEEALAQTLAEALVSDTDTSLEPDVMIDPLEEDLEKMLAEMNLDSDDGIADKAALTGIDTDSIDTELEKALAGLDDGAAAPVSIADEAVLDLQIEEALALEDEVDSVTTDRAQGVEDFVKNADIYADDNADYVLPEKPRRFAVLTAKIEGISPKFLFAATVVLTVSVAVTAFLTVSLAISSSRVRAEYNQRGNIIRLGGVASNSAGFIFVNIPVNFINKDITLTKINMSRISTVLYFDGFIDLDIYDASITDDWGRTYYIDHSYYERDNHADDDFEMRLWFDSLPTGFKFFDLTITERDTAFSTKTRFSAGQNFTFEPARYLNETVTVDCGSDEAEVKITGAVFSNTGSQIGLAMRQAIPGEEVVLSRPGSDEWVTLTENGRIIIPDSHSFAPRIFADHGVTLGRIDFIPLQNLNSTVRIHFDDMYRKITTVSEICLEDIFYTKPNSEHVMNLGAYRVVIERGGIQGNQFVLVMHAVDTRMEAISELSNRVQAFPEVTMIARKNDGSSIRLEPRLIRDAWQGTDVVFDGREEREFLLGMPANQIFFEINGVYFKLPPTHIELDLSNAERKLPINPSTALENITLMFNRRLEHKTGLYRLDELDRFSPMVLSDSRLMSRYAPTSATDTSSVIHVPMWYLDGDRFYAIVRETWRAYPNEFFHRVHKTVSQYGNHGWIIIKDEVIE